MKPGNSPEVVVILDTIPELEVVKQSVERVPSGIMGSIAYCRSEYEESMVGRFLSQTRVGGDGNPMYASDSGEGWQDNPEFEVHRSDVRSLTFSAEKIVEQGGPLSLMSKAGRARKKAAKNILEALSS